MRRSSRIRARSFRSHLRCRYFSLRRYWRWKSRSPGGRPQIDADLRALIQQMSVDNPLWGAPRIHYASEYYRTSEMRLRFAADDERAFWRYAMLAGGAESDTRLHRLLLDREATFDRLSSAVSELAAAGPVDVFFLYLSGHGEQVGPEVGWFCLADAQPARLSLGGTVLDDLLHRINADHVCVVIDCYAEAVASKLNFFAELEGKSGRLLVTSHREISGRGKTKLFNVRFSPTCCCARYRPNRRSQPRPDMSTSRRRCSPTCGSRCHSSRQPRSGAVCRSPSPEASAVQNSCFRLWRANHWAVH